jgi:hypothetical protein
MLICHSNLVLTLRDIRREFGQDEELSVDNLDANIYTRSKFVTLIQEHQVRALISIFLPNDMIWKKSVNFEDQFHLDLGTVDNFNWRTLTDSCRDITYSL